MQNVTNFLVKCNSNETISLSDTGATISCMPKASFDKLDPKPKLMQSQAFKVNGTDGNSCGPLGTTICILEYPRKFQQHFIVYEQLF